MRIKYLVNAAKTSFTEAKHAEERGDSVLAATAYLQAARYFDRLLIVAPWHCAPDAARVARIRAELALL